MKTLKHIGADFHRAMVATAPGEKLLRPPPYVRNWTQLQWQMVTPYDIKLVLYKKNTFVSYKNQQKLLLPEQHFLTPVCTKSFVGSGFAPGRGGQRKGRGGRKFFLRPREKKKSRRLCRKESARLTASTG